MSRFHIARQIPSNASIPLSCSTIKRCSIYNTIRVLFMCPCISKNVSNDSEPSHTHLHIHHINVCNVHMHMAQTVNMTWSTHLIVCMLHKPGQCSSTMLYNYMQYATGHRTIGPQPLIYRNRTD